ncbi:protein tumorous imaginal discs, mitochondrial-like isoform X2 [Prorops nasuta]|uniref:protein tumorous imaginal discs, mitochondrial-like isoform X2 n=1 Tax=Prorops nasuta TaxID=863751 RepID=UPI0034CDE68D
MMATGKGLVTIFRPKSISFITFKFNKLPCNVLQQFNFGHRSFTRVAFATTTWKDGKYEKRFTQKLSQPRRLLHLTNRSLAPRRNYYEILGISKNSSTKDIKKAYYELAKKYHPDTNKGDPNAGKKFQEVSEAYEVLSDETKRKEYDTWGATSEQMGMGSKQGAQGFNQSWEFKSNVNPEELFRKIFGDAFKGSDFGDFDDYASSKFGYGAAQEVIMNLTFSQAARGVNKEIELNVVDVCPMCNGNRCAPGYAPLPCTYCNGTGMETMTTGPFVMRSTCRYCHGKKEYIKYPCPECHTKGQVVMRKKVIVPVPAGVEEGQTIRISVGKKEVFVTFRVEKSKYFRRDGPDVHTDASISLSQAALGGSIRIEGVYEDHTIQIRPGTSSHSKIRLTGKGLKRVNTLGHGDHYVHIKIISPTYLTEKQKALLLTYAELEDNTTGSINGITYKNDGPRKQERESSDDNDEDQKSRDDGLLTKIKRAIFG